MQKLKMQSAPEDGQRQERKEIQLILSLRRPKLRFSTGYKKPFQIFFAPPVFKRPLRPLRLIALIQPLLDQYNNGHFAYAASTT